MPFPLFQPKLTNPWRCANNCMYTCYEFKNVDNISGECKKENPPKQYRVWEPFFKRWHQTHRTDIKRSSLFSCRRHKNMRTPLQMQISVHSNFNNHTSHKTDRSPAHTPTPPHTVHTHAHTPPPHPNHPLTTQTLIRTARMIRMTQTADGRWNHYDSTRVVRVYDGMCVCVCICKYYVSCWSEFSSPPNERRLFIEIYGWALGPISSRRHSAFGGQETRPICIYILILGFI